MAIKNVSISISVPDDVLKAIDEIAERRRRSRSYIYLEAAEMLLANQTNPPKITQARKKAGAR
jgi:predicted transcriptional regulator